MGICSSTWCILFLGCKWNEWDSNPLHHLDPNTNTIPNHVPIRSIDVKFGTNDVKYHFFTLMAFDFHCTEVLIAWVIITNWQTCEDLVEWLIPLQAKLVANKPNWKPLCFIVHDSSQKLWALQRVYFVLIFLLYFHSFRFASGWGMHTTMFWNF
jgi:hypothetical protein